MMWRRILIILCLIGFFLSAALWFAQLREPIHLADGPEFLDVEWLVTDNIPGGPGWGMLDPSGAKEVHSKTAGSGLGFYAVEVPEDEAPPLEEDSLLLGAGSSRLHLGLAYFHDVPDPETPPAPGMVYVCPCHVAMSIPFWLLVLLFGAYPTLAFIRGPLRRHRRRKRGQCVQCGYDLTGNVSGFCPECGRPAAQEVTVMRFPRLSAIAMAACVLAGCVNLDGALRGIGVEAAREITEGMPWLFLAEGNYILYLPENTWQGAQRHGYVELSESEVDAAVTNGDTWRMHARPISELSAEIDARLGQQDQIIIIIPLTDTDTTEQRRAARIISRAGHRPVIVSVIVDDPGA